jgi:hypothetical protein
LLLLRENRYLFTVQCPLHCFRACYITRYKVRRCLRQLFFVRHTLFHCYAVQSASLLFTLSAIIVYGSMSTALFQSLFTLPVQSATLLTTSGFRQAYIASLLRGTKCDAYVYIKTSGYHLMLAVLHTFTHFK